MTSRYQAILIAVLTGLAIWQYAASKHTAWAILSGVLSVTLGVLVQRALDDRRDEREMHRDVVALTSVYYQEPKLLGAMLRPEWLDQSISNLINAAMGDDDIGTAYSRQAVFPFIHCDEYRLDFMYDIDLPELPAAGISVTVGDATTLLERGQYRGLHSTLSYTTKVVSPADTVFVSILFAQNELPEWFKRPNHLLREVVDLPSALTTFLADTVRTTVASSTIDLAKIDLANVDQESVHRLVTAADQLFGVTLRLGHETCGPMRLHITKQGMSFEFALPEDFRELMRRGLAEIAVDVRTLIGASQTSFPVGIVAPTRHPSVNFSWASSDIAEDGIQSEVFYSAHRPFEARRRAERRRLSVLTGRDDWVFAGSGCVFMWHRIGDGPERGRGVEDVR